MPTWSVSLVAALALASICAGTSPSVAATPGTPDTTTVTRHELRLAGAVLPYTVEAGRLPIRDVETGEPHGFIFYTAYRVRRGGQPRPLTFVWNGGPGSDASTLEFHVAGPKRVVGGRLVDNTETWLTASDLVFVDPVGAGFSRPAKSAYAQEFYGTVGDVMSITEFVRAWRLIHQAEDQPLYLAGESWGANRAGSVAYQLQMRGVPVAGLVLLSGGAGLNTDPVPSNLREALRVADFAVTSVYHDKVAGDAEAAHDATEAWARRVYAPALGNLAALSTAQREEVIEGLASHLGLPKDAVDATSLRLTPRTYRTRLLPGRTLNIFDMRRIGDTDEAIDAKPILTYLRKDLGYVTDAPYVGLESIEQGYAPDGHYPAAVNERWNYATAPVTPEALKAAVAEAERTGGGPPRLGPPLPSVAELVKRAPDVRILVAAGQYDSLNSCTVNRELARRLDPALSRALSFRCYPGGHMMYTDEAARVALSRDVFVLLSGGR